jgi:hypothetical protein
LKAQYFVILLQQACSLKRELLMGEKNRLSHQARAVMNARGILRKVFIG